MHLYVLARGQVDQLRRWVNDLTAQRFSYKYSKDEPKGLLQLSVRPVMLFEIVFPEEHLQEVLKMTRPSGRMTKLAHTIGRTLGLKKIPKFEEIQNYKIMNQWISCIGVGIKKDKKDRNGIELL